MGGKVFGGKEFPVPVSVVQRRKRKSTRHCIIRISFCLYTVCLQGFLDVKSDTRG